MWILVFIALMSFRCSAALELRALNNRNQTITEIEVGTPFKVEVTGDIDTQKSLTLNPIDGLDILGQTVHRSINIIQGASSVKQNVEFTVALTKPGTFMLGPASIGSEQSNQVKIKAIQAQPIDQATAAQFLRLTTLHPKILKGQKIELVLRLYSLNNNLQVESIESPKIDNAVAQWQGPYASTQIVNNQQYFVYEWHLFSYPKAEGALTIPALKMEYALVTPIMFGFAVPGQLKTLYSNALTIEVEPLPPYKEPVQGVGHFSEFTAQLNEKEAKNAAAFTLSLKGDNLESVEIPQLVLPAGLKYYPPAVKFKQPDTKLFEYVILAERPGDYTIPAQQFTYFDPDTQIFNQLATQPLQLTITQVETVQPQQPAGSIKPSEEAPDVEHPCTTKYWRAQSKLSLPWWLFFALAIMPLLLLLFQSAKKRFYSAKRVAFKRAARQLKKARRENNTGNLGAIFSELFATWIPAAEDHNAFLLHKGFSKETVARWQVFFNTIMALSYGAGRQENNADLFNTAQRWIDAFQKVA